METIHAFLQIPIENFRLELENSVHCKSTDNVKDG